MQGTLDFSELRHPGQPRVGHFHKGAKSTEIEAAKARVHAVGEQSTKLLKALVEAGSHGLIRREICDRTDIDISSVCSILADLVKYGWVYESYRKRVSEKTGKKGHVFIATDRGKRVFEGRSAPFRGTPTPASQDRPSSPLEAS